MQRYLLTLFLVLALPSWAATGEQCGYVSNNVCVEGPETRMMDGMEVTRACWKYESKFGCVQAAVTDTCGPPISKGCTDTSSSCVEKIKLGGVDVCITTEHEYTCNVIAPSSSTVADCSDQQLCVDGNCFDSQSKPDKDFALAVTGMEVMREGGAYMDDTSFQLFKGQANTCGKNVVRNCCQKPSSPTSGLTNAAITGGSEYAYDVLAGPGMRSIAFAFDPTAFALAISNAIVTEMLKCEKDEVLLAVKRDHHLCHYVGQYCSKSINLLFRSICIQKKEAYCCFTSKIGRIMNEAAREQLPSLGWGSSEGPSCNGITIAQFQSLDLSKVDFREFYVDIKPTPLNEAATTANAVTKVNSYFSEP